MHIQGQELYSNYGQLSNETLLYAYGFAIPGNKNDTVALRLATSSSSSSSRVVEGSGSTVQRPMSSVYYISSGGLAGIPSELWRALSSLGEVVSDPADEDEQVEEEEALVTGTADADTDTADAPQDEQVGSSASTDDDPDEAASSAPEDGVDAEEAIEIGYEECEMLLEYLQHKLDTLEASQSR